MSARPKFRPEEFTQPEKLPVSLGLEREDRVALLGQCAQALLAGKLPDAPARLFVGGALMAWLQGGGDLSRDYFRITKRASRRTATAIWREIQNGHHDDARHPDESQPHDSDE
jgi:hypothetical protein